MKQNIRLALFAGMLALVGSAHAQQLVAILLKSGQRVETLGVRRDGDTVMGKIKVAGSSGEIGYQVAQVARIEFPEPKGLRNASELLEQGEPAKALSELEPIVTYYTPFKDIAGSWWSQAVLLKVTALGALRRDAEAEKLAAEIRSSPVDADTARAASLRTVAGMIARQEFDKAAQLCDEVLKESSERATLADAWVQKGDVLLAQKQWDAALLAYLHVAVFYRDARLALPPALLGSVKAYRRLEDVERARKASEELAATFPNAPQVRLAQAEIQKMKP